MDIRNVLVIVKTNWVSLLLTFIVVYVYAFMRAYITTNFTFYQAVYSSLILVFLYGLVFWIGLTILLIVLDIFIVGTGRKQLAIRLFWESVIICIPFIFWAVKYGQIIFGVGAIAFMLGQIIRLRIIRKCIQN